MTVRDLALAARRAGRTLAAIDHARRSRLLNAVADALVDPATQSRILEANDADVRRARDEQGRGEIASSSVERLVLDATKLQGLADGLRQLAGQPELVGQQQLRRELDDDLVLTRVAVPLGVLGVVFESRPDAVPQITGLAMKSGNAVLLKGGKEAHDSNVVLVETLRRTLEGNDLDPNAVALLESRAQVDEMLALEDVIDLVIARGSATFVRHVMASTDIPVLGHAAGLCHLYLHGSADPAVAARIAVDAKCSYPAACNAIETLLWDETAGAALDACVTALREAGVELRGCPASRERHRFMTEASESDWDTEYGALILSVRRVRDLDEALAHIERHGSRHTEAIVADDTAAAERFLAEVDAAGVFHNASTRFADGYRYGLGAEVGVGTGKLHARGPVGVEGLLTYRWLLRGRGEIASEYGPGKKTFKHRDLPPQ